MKLPLLLSVPHAGLTVPDLTKNICVLTLQEIMEDGDEGAAEIYDLERDVAKLVRTDVARAIVDMNRPEDDFRPDGVIKTHTCWGVEVYSEFPSSKVIEELLEKYHRPYHAGLSDVPEGVILGVDCHTMAAVGPDIGPGAGVERPPFCVSNADGSCPNDWARALAHHLQDVSGKEARVNDPFNGGHIIRAHAPELPWVQVEISRAPFASDSEKRSWVLEGLRRWCADHP